MNVTTSGTPSEDHYANSSPGRGTGFPRSTANVSAYSEGNLLSVSPVKQPHTVYPSPQDIRHNIYGSSGCKPFLFYISQIIIIFFNVLFLFQFFPIPWIVPVAQMKVFLHWLLEMPVLVPCKRALFVKVKNIV